MKRSDFDVMNGADLLPQMNKVHLDIQTGGLGAWSPQRTAPTDEHAASI